MSESVSVVKSGDDFRVNPKSCRFDETVDLSTGSFHHLSGLTVESLPKQPEMHAIVMLAHQGWTVGSPSSVDSYMHGSDKRFLGSGRHLDGISYVCALPVLCWISCH